MTQAKHTQTKYQGKRKCINNKIIGKYNWKYLIKQKTYLIESRLEFSTSKAH